MVADNSQAKTSNWNILRQTLNGRTTPVAIHLDGCFHVMASDIRTSNKITLTCPLRLTGGELVIHTDAGAYIWDGPLVKGSNPAHSVLMALANGCAIEADGVTFTNEREGLWNHLQYVFASSITVRGSYLSGLSEEVDRVRLTRCTFRVIGALRLTMRVNERADGKGAYADVGYGDILVSQCSFDVTVPHVIYFSGGIIRNKCIIEHNHVVNLNGSFFTFDCDGSAADVRQFRHNRPIIFRHNYLTTRQPSAAEYVTALLTKNHAAQVYGNTFDHFFGANCVREDLLLMRTRGSGLENVINENVLTVEGNALCGFYEIYASVAELDFHDNIITDCLAYNLGDQRDSYPSVTTCKSKQRYETDITNYRRICHNRWTWDEQACRNLLEDAYDHVLTPLNTLRQAAGLAPYSVTKEAWIRQQYYTSLFDYVANIDEITFEHNVVSIPGGVIHGVSVLNNPIASTCFHINDNLFSCQKITGALCRFRPMMTLAPTKVAHSDTYEGLPWHDWDVLLGDLVTPSDGHYALRLLDGSAVQPGYSYGGRPWEWWVEHRYACISFGVNQRASFTIGNDTYTTLSINDIYSLKRLVNRNGEVCRVKYIYHRTVRDGATKNSWMEFIFIDDGVTLVKNTDNRNAVECVTYYVMRHALPEVEVCRNTIHTDESAMPVLLLRSLCNMPIQGNDGYGSGDILMWRNAFGRVTVSGNSITGAAYVSDPGYTQHYTEEGNTANADAVFTKMPFSAGSWRDIAVRNFSSDDQSEIRLPAAYGVSDNGNMTSLDIVVNGVKNLRRWHTRMRFTREAPLKFYLYDYFDRAKAVDDDGYVEGVHYLAGTSIISYAMTLDYSVGGQPFHKQMTFTIRGYQTGNAIRTLVEGTADEHVGIIVTQGKDVSGGLQRGIIGGGRMTVVSLFEKTRADGDVIIGWSRLS